MPLMLTKNNVQQHCLTCLLDLDIEGQCQPKSEPGAYSAKMVNVNELDLHEMLVRHLDWPAAQLTNLEMPQYLCITCYNKLLSFDKFRRRALLCLEELLAVIRQPEEHDAPGVTFEIIYEQTENADDASKDDLHSALPTNVELLEPDTVLLEAQSVVLKRASAHTSPLLLNCDVIEPDPFEMTQNCKLESADSDDDNAYEDAMKTGPCTRQRKRLDAAAGTKKVPKNHFKCIVCQRSFAHKVSLSAHVRKVHEGSKRPYQCDRCDKAYSFMGGLYTHIKEIHEPLERRYPCDQEGCDRIYTSSISLQKHKRVKHTATESARLYVCEECGATFNQTSNLKYHRRTKHPTPEEAAVLANSQDRYYCEVCQKTYHSRYTLKYHKLQQHPQGEMPHECQVCGKRVAAKFMLAQHMMIHSEDRIPCEHCGKSFVRKFELVSHIRAVHLKIKPWACKYCGESFATGKTLRHHEYIHTGEKPYECNICGQSYRQRSGLKNHRKVHS